MQTFYFILENPIIENNENFVTYARRQLQNKEKNFIFYADQNEANKLAKPPCVLASILILNDKQMIGKQSADTIQKFTSNDLCEFHLLYKSNQLMLLNAINMEEQNFSKEFLFSEKRINKDYNANVIEQKTSIKKQDNYEYKTFYFALKQPGSEHQGTAEEYVKDKLKKDRTITFFEKEEWAKNELEAPYVLGSIKIRADLIIDNQEIKNAKQICSSSVNRKDVFFEKCVVISGDNNNEKNNHINLDINLIRAVSNDTPEIPKNIRELDDLKKGNEVLTNLLDDNISTTASTSEVSNNNENNVSSKNGRHFYIQFNIATKTIFTLFNNLKDDYQKIIGSLILKELNNKPVTADAKPNTDKQNDIAYLSCSTSDEEIAESIINNISIQLNKSKEKVSVDKIDIKFYHKKENKNYDMTFKNNRKSPSLFFKETNSFGSFSFSPHVCDNNEYDHYVGNNSKKYTPLFYIKKSISKDEIESGFNETTFREYAINYAKDLHNTANSPHNFEQVKQFEKEDSNLSDILKNHVTFEIYFSENDVIDNQLREDYNIEKIIVNHAENDNNIKKLTISEKEIYPELEITPYNLSLN